MTTTGAGWLAWPLCLLTLAMLVGAVAMPADTPGGLGLLAPQLLWSAANAVVGAVVAARRPRLPIGWLLCAIAALTGTALLAGRWAYHTLVDAPDALPAGQAALWLSTWPFTAGFLLLPFLFLLFPTGRLPSPRWRPLARVAVAVYALNVFGTAFAPGPVSEEDFGPLPNPLAIEALGRFGDTPQTVVPALMLLVVLAAVASLLVRLRRSRGVERQQLKWFAYAAALFGAATFVNVALSQLGSTQADVIATTVPIVALPVAIGIAVLRRRLFDIDRVINRTIVYGLLSALLGLVYLAAVVLLGRVLAPFTGDNAQAVAGSTLAVAALFSPARRRVQALVDRRFDRRRYDAARTVAAFSTRLRDQVELDALSRELLAVIQATVQPTRASIWLAPRERRAAAGGATRVAARPR
jgi:hypothetical protein